MGGQRDAVNSGSSSGRIVLFEGIYRGSNPCPEDKWLRDGIGIHICLRSKVMSVRVAPKLNIWRFLVLTMIGGSENAFRKDIHTAILLGNGAMATRSPLERENRGSTPCFPISLHAAQISQSNAQISGYSAIG
jgi:hypothetical protein